VSKIEIEYLKNIENADLLRDNLAIENKGLFFHSSARINFLKDYLKAKDLSIGALINGKLVGFLNLLIKDGPFGKVANSSPYYGSNGGIILDLTLPEELQIEIKKSLIDFTYRVEQENNMVLTCIITNPLYQDADFYRKGFKHDFEDYRIGQLTPLPDSEEKLFLMFHYKTRNMIRKAQKFGFDIYTTHKEKDVDFLYETHKENIGQMKGLAKTKDYFEKSLFHSDYEWNLWIASYKSERAAAMLLYKFGDVIEYVTPVIKHKYRSHQSLSLLIYEAMKEATKAKRKWWNWGGTWKTQDGVYRFKKRWGAIDMNYYYFIRFSSSKKKEAFTNSSKEFLLSNYKYFYIVPFSLIKD